MNIHENRKEVRQTVLVSFIQIQEYKVLDLQ